MKTQSSKTRTLLTGAVLVALAATPLAGADYSSTILSQGPVGYWRLNEAVQPQNIAGAANLGLLGAGALGTYNNFPTRGLPGPFAGSTAVGLDGGSQSVTTPWHGELNYTNNFSVEMWVNPAQVPKFAYMASSVHIASPRTGWYMAQDDGSTFLVGSAFVVRMFYNNGANFSGFLYAPVTTAGVWYHIVLTYNGTTAALYTNGVLAMSQTIAPSYVGNVDSQTSFGSRSDNNFYWPGQQAEVAMYSTTLSAARVAAHYTAATTTPGSYATTVQSDSPQLYYRFQEAIDPPAVNLGSKGSAANGLYIYDTHAGSPGPVSPPFSGFETTNKAASFDALGGVVRIPALNLNTNALTISGWINATGSQAQAAGLVICNGGTTTSGLTIDQQFSGLGLGYVWGGNNYGWSPSSDSFLPQLPDSQWAYVALVIEPSQATLYICDVNNYANFTSVANTFNVAHANQAFDSATLIGSEAGFTATRSFNGGIDEVAIFNRSLTGGELYTQYGAGVGGVPPRIFADLQPPAPTYVGDPLVLKVDAGGTPALGYNWHKNGGGSPIATTTNGVFIIPNASLGDSGNYDVTVTNASGNAQSATVAVTINPASSPSVSQLIGFKNRTLYKGATLTMGVVAGGGGLKYLWYKNSALVGTATASSYVVPSVTTNDAGSYSVVVTNTLGVISNGPVAIAIPNMATNSYEGLIISSAPEAWWRLGEAPGGTNLWDGMGRHDGTYTNTSGVTLGVAGALSNDPDTAASFNGTGGLGLIPYSSALNPIQFTVEGWVKTSATDNIVPFSSSYGSLGWWAQAIGGWWYGDCNAGYFGNNGNVNTAAQIVAGQWSHVVIEFDSTRVIGGTHYPFVLYVNGQTDGFVWGGVDPNNAGPFLIGGRGVSATTLADRFFNGQVDEVAMYKRLVPQAELLAHFNGRFGSTTVPYFIPPSFVSQTVTPGKSLTYSTTPYGSLPMTLQWYKDGVKFGNQSVLNTATLVSQAFTNTAVTNTGTYTLWATNGAGVGSISFTLTVIPPVAYANVTNGLVLHLKFDGDLTDSSGRGNSATPVGSPTFISGHVGSGAFHYNTDTTNTIYNYATLGPTPNDLKFGASGNFTVSYWARFPAGAAPGDLPFLCSAATSTFANGLTIAPSYQRGGWAWSLNGVGLYGADNSINDGNWHNVITTFDRTGNALTYLDGVQVSSYGIAAAGNIDQTGPMNIGQDPTGTYAESGSLDIDDLGIWSRLLTPVEVAKLESAGRTGGRSFDTVAPPVTLSIAKSGTNLTLSWATGTLLQSDTLGTSAVWTPVSGASAPSYTFAPGTTRKFYKVQTQ